MRDEKTLRLAFRPISAEALTQHMRLVALELGGAKPEDALKESGLSAEDVVRIAAAVNGFCRPRLLKRRLAKATAKDEERAKKQAEALQAPVDDSELVALYGEDTHRVLLAHEAELVALRERAVVSPLP